MAFIKYSNDFTIGKRGIIIGNFLKFLNIDINLYEQNIPFAEINRTLHIRDTTIHVPLELLSTNTSDNTKPRVAIRIGNSTYYDHLTGWDIGSGVNASTDNNLFIKDNVHNRRILICPQNSYGQLLKYAGSDQTRPDYSFISDDTSGISLTAAGQIGISVSGSRRFNVRSNGINIGTNTTISLEGNSTMGMEINSTSAASSSQITCSNSNNTSYIGLLSGVSGDTTSLIQYRNGVRFAKTESPNTQGHTLSMAINSNGDVLINTLSNPDSRKLLVNGDIGCSNIYSTNISGTISTGPQPNITSLAGLSSIRNYNINDSIMAILSSVNQQLTSTSDVFFNTVRFSNLIQRDSSSIPVNTETDRYIHLISSSNTKYSQITCGSSTDTPLYHVGMISGRNSQTVPRIYFKTHLAFVESDTPTLAGAVELMRLTSGNLLINTTTNAENNRLYVNGTIRSTGLRMDGKLMIGKNTPNDYVYNSSSITLVAENENVSSKISCHSGNDICAVGIMSGRNTDPLGVELNSLPIIYFNRGLRFSIVGDNAPLLWTSDLSLNEVMRIDLNRNLLIGTQDNPLGRRLLVSGDIQSINIHVGGNVNCVVVNSTNVNCDTVTATDVFYTNISGNNITGTNISGTITTGNQPNITSLQGLNSIQGQVIEASKWVLVANMQDVSVGASPSFVASTFTDSLVSSASFSVRSTSSSGFKIRTAANPDTASDQLIFNLQTDTPVGLTPARLHVRYNGSSSNSSRIFTMQTAAVGLDNIGILGLQTAGGQLRLGNTLIPSSVAVAGVSISNARWTTVQNLVTGTWSPVLTINNANVVSTITQIFRYFRVGDQVMFVGLYTFGAVTGTSSFDISMSIPIASTFSSVTNARGTITASSSISASLIFNCILRADTATNLVRMEMTSSASVPDATVVAVSISGMYAII